MGTTASAPSGTHGAGQDAHGGAGLDVGAGFLSGGDLTHDGEQHGRERRGRRHIGAAHREAIHGAVVPAWQRHERRGVLSEDRGPRLAASGTVSDDSGRTSRSMRARASSSEIRPSCAI